jgi:hypothetical protein
VVWIYLATHEAKGARSGGSTVLGGERGSAKQANVAAQSADKKINLMHRKVFIKQILFNNFKSGLR